MPRGCLVKKRQCFEGTIMFHVGQQIMLSVRIALCLRLLNDTVSLANIMKKVGTMLRKVLWVPRS